MLSSHEPPRVGNCHVPCRKASRLPSKSDATELASLTGAPYQKCVKALLKRDNDVLAAAEELLMDF